MGMASIEVTGELRAQRGLTNTPTACKFTARGASRHDDRFFLSVSSPLLADDCHGCQEIIVEGDSIRFKRWADV